MELLESADAGQFRLPEDAVDKEGTE